MPDITNDGRYAVEVVADRSGKFCGNGLRFETIGDATDYAKNLWSRWTLVTRARVIDTRADDAVVVEDALGG